MNYLKVMLGSLVLGVIFEQESKKSISGKEFVASPYKWEGLIAQSNESFSGYLALEGARQFFLDRLPIEVHYLVKFIDSNVSTKESIKIEKLLSICGLCNEPMYRHHIC